MKTGFFEESQGVRSANRLVFIIGMIWLMGISSYVVIEKLASLTELGLFFGVIAGILYAGKLVQKMQENKPEISTTGTITTTTNADLNITKID